MTKKKKILIIAIPILAIGLIAAAFNFVKKANEAKQWEIVVSAREQLELNHFDEAEEILSQLNGDQFAISIKRELKTLKALQGTWKCTGEYDPLYDKINPLDYGFAFEIEGHIYSWDTSVGTKMSSEMFVGDGRIIVNNVNRVNDWEYEIVRNKNTSDIQYLREIVTDFIYTKQS